jgi:hypothetical protein
LYEADRGMCKDLVNPVDERVCVLIFLNK